MSDAAIGLSGILLLFALIALRLPIGVSMIVVSAGGIATILDFEPMATLLR